VVSLSPWALFVKWSSKIGGGKMSGSVVFESPGETFPTPAGVMAGLVTNK